MLPHTDPEFTSDQLHKSLTNLPYLSGSSTPNPHRGYQSSSMPKTASSQARASTPMAKNGLVRASCPTTTGRSSCEPEASFLVPRSSTPYSPPGTCGADSCPLTRPCCQLTVLFFRAPSWTRTRKRMGSYHVVLCDCGAVASFTTCHSSLQTPFLIAYISRDFFHKFGT